MDVHLQLRVLRTSSVLSDHGCAALDVMLDVVRPHWVAELRKGRRFDGFASFFLFLLSFFNTLYSSFLFDVLYSGYLCRFRGTPDNPITTSRSVLIPSSYNLRPTLKSIMSKVRGKKEKGKSEKKVKEIAGSSCWLECYHQMVHLACRPSDELDKIISWIQ